MQYYGLVGNPVSHSLSEKYFTDKFFIEGINARYERFLLNDIGALKQLLASYPDLKGLSVTSPFKESVIPYCDELDETASAIRAVNTLRITHNEENFHIKGFNTDVDGFAAVLWPLLGKKYPDALILGSGGAARAVAFALSRIGIKYLIVSRRPGNGRIGYDDLTPGLVKKNGLIINATPLGMAKFAGQSPALPYPALTPKHILFDLIYNPSETEFLRRAKQAGARGVNGLMMLQAQAEKAWQIWTIE